MADENTNPAAAQDTRTRKTVRLRSAAPQTQDVPLSDPLTNRDTDTGNLEILDDTQTRKTLKLKPMAPGAGALPKVNISAGDTNTRKTVVLHPVNAPTAMKSTASKRHSLFPMNDSFIWTSPFFNQLRQNLWKPLKISI